MIYLDNNATTFLDPEVLKAMLPLYTDCIGNASSMHSCGQHAKQLLIDAKKRTAAYFGVSPTELIFVSGATEGLNLLIRSFPKEGGHLITSSLEHVAVREAVNQLSVSITRLDPEPYRGAISAKQIAEAIQPDTKMIVLMAANNETGIMSDIEEIGELAASKGIFLIVDGVALLGKEVWRGWPRGVSALCVSGHKIHGPQGVGCVLFRKPFKLKTLIHGGPQQYGLRGGTENLAAIVGFAKALEQINPAQIAKMRELRDRFEKGVMELLPQAEIHGFGQPRVSNTSNIAFPDGDGEMLLMHLDLEGVAVSHGAACSSGALEPSHVLLNMGIPKAVVRRSLRFSLSRFTTEAEIEEVLGVLRKLYAHRTSQLEVMGGVAHL